MTLAINWYTYAGVYISNTISAAVVLPATTAEYVYITGGSPTNAYYGIISYGAIGTPASTVTFYADKVRAIAGTGDYVPPVFQDARQLQTIVKPTRLNYVMNPSFETSVATWSEVGTGVTLATDTTHFASPGGSWEVSYTGNGSTANPQIWASPNFPVTTGVTYSAAAWLGCSPVYASGQTISIVFWNAALTKILGTVTSASVTSLAPTLATASGQAPVGSAWAIVIIGAAGTPASSTTFYAAATELTASNWLQPPPATIWSGVNNATVTTISPFTPQVVTSLAGTQSMKVALSANTGSGVQCSVPYLIPGETYMASAYVQPGTQLADILISVGSANGDVNSSIADAVGYGAGTYGGGSYGGIPATNVALPTGYWTRIAVQFVAASDTVALQITAVPVTSVSYPVNFWVDGALLEIGDILNPYFDGNSGTADYMWEAGGVANLTRSYYYQRYEFGQHVVANTLLAQTPFGINAAAPLYATVPTQ